jgi:hypothetical protein
VLDAARGFRALRIGDPDDLVLLQATSQGELATAGFRNRDLRALLHPASASLAPCDQQRLSARVSRQLRLLRARGLIRKVPRTHRYPLTERGRLLTAALFATRNSNIKQLLATAA